MRISNKLKLLAASMLVAPAAVSAAYAQDADDLNAQALAQFRAGADETAIETGLNNSAVFDGSGLDPRGEGDIDAELETSSGAGSSADAWDGAVEDAGNAADDAARETGEWVDDVGDDVGDDLDEAGQETGDFFDDLGEDTTDKIDETADETDGFIDEAADDVEDIGDDLGDPLDQ